MYENASKYLIKNGLLDPNNVSTFWSRGMVNKMLGKYVDIVEDLDKAHELEPNDAFTLKSRRKVKSMNDEQKLVAMVDLNKAHKLVSLNIQE